MDDAELHNIRVYSTVVRTIRSLLFRDHRHHSELSRHLHLPGRNLRATYDNDYYHYNHNYDADYDNDDKATASTGMQEY